MNKKSRLIFVLIGVIIVLILISGFVLNQTMRQIISDIIFKGLFMSKVSQEPVTTTTEVIVIGGEPESPSVPVICSPVDSGAQTYSVSTKNNPLMTQVDINPLDVKISASQTVSVKIRETNEKPITEVSGIIVTDNQTLPFVFVLVSGTDINGTWQGSWLNRDSYCQTYMLTIVAISESGQSRVEMAFK